MSQQLALLICASPANREHPSVYVSAGLWRPDISEVKDSLMQVYIEEPIFSENWLPYILKDEQYIEGPGNFMICFTKCGTEKQITIMLDKVQ